jgi:membrane-bound lytic murein transglycosylase D
MTIMEKNAAEYGLDGVQMDAPLEYDTVKTDSLTGLALVGDITDTPLSELAALNPAALRGMLPEGHTLHIPKGTGNAVSAALALIPAERRASWRMHLVASDESLAAIGKRYGVSPASIMAANRLTSARAEEGDRLMIPTAARPEPLARPAARSSAAHRPGHPATTTARGSRATPARPSAAAKTYHRPTAIVASAAGSKSNR